MRHENSRILFAYWERIRSGRQAPRREEIEPSDIRHLLGDTFILDVSDSLRTISYRLAGTRLCAAYGKELKGMGFLVPWDEMECFEISRMLTKVYRDFQPHVLCSLGKTASGKFVKFETIFLPLQPVSNGNFRILGISTPTKTPYWLGAEPITSTTVRSIRPIADLKITVNNNVSIAPEYGSDGHPDNSQLTGNDDQQAAEAIRKVAHLTVHDGGKP